MDRPLRVLLVEDSQRDVALEVHALEAAGYRVTYSMVDTAAGMKAALAGQSFDIVLSDHDLPQFDAPGALAVFKQSGLDIPFIIVSGALGEEQAVALMRAGAQDYVMKDRLSRLASAVEHALKDTENQRELKRSELRLEKSEERYRTLVQKAFEGIIVIQEGKIVFANLRAYEMIDFPRDSTEPRPFMDFVHPEDREKVIDRHLRRLKGEKFEEIYPIRLIDRNGKIKWTLISAARIEWEGQPATLTFLTDISEIKKAEEELRESEGRYRLLADHTTDTIRLMDMNLKTTYLSPSAERLRGFTYEEILELPLEKQITSESLRTASAILSEELPRIKADPDYNPIHTLDLEYLCKDGTTVWAESKFSVIRDKNGEPVSILAEARDISERKLSEEKLLKSYESVKKTLNDAIDTIAKIVEVRDPYTAGHQQKVAELATVIAGEIKLDDTRIDNLRMAAVIHDIGKMYVPSDILSKPGKLSDMEFALIKTHVQGGYDIIKGMDFPHSVAQSVLEHHERLDGSGYPNQIKGEDMLLEAKILAVADVVEAMASHRPYRPALGIAKALDELSKNKGILYDPDVVNICLELFTKKGFKFKE